MPTDALPPASLAIDAANNQACSHTDQRGLKRLVLVAPPCAATWARLSCTGLALGCPSYFVSCQ